MMGYKSLKTWDVMFQLLSQLCFLSRKKKEEETHKAKKTSLPNENSNKYRMHLLKVSH